MPFDKETEELIKKDEQEAKERWDKMTEAEREEIRAIGRRFAKKVDSCYPEDKPKKG